MKNNIWLALAIIILFFGGVFLLTKNSTPADSNDGVPEEQFSVTESDFEKLKNALPAGFIYPDEYASIQNIEFIPGGGGFSYLSSASLTELSLRHQNYLTEKGYKFSVAKKEDETPIEMIQAQGEIGENLLIMIIEIDSDAREVIVSYSKLTV